MPREHSSVGATVDTAYTVRDVIAAECSLDPLTCVHCGTVGEVVFNQGVADGRCQVCGKWQLEGGADDGR